MKVKFAKKLFAQEKKKQERKYLPTLAELVDRLSITQLKSIFIPDHKQEYDEECSLIEHDIDLILSEKNYKLTSSDIRSILVIMLSNRVIWENESKARAGGSDQDNLLKFTHSINGVRNTAKNILSANTGDRKDYKIDAFAASLVEEFGAWKIWKENS